MWLKLNGICLDQADHYHYGLSNLYGQHYFGLKTVYGSNPLSVGWPRAWQGKLAAGFTNGGGLSGDKLAVLQQINLFAMQHGMLWSGLPFMPTGRSPHDINRMSSFLGLMTQSDNASVEVTPPEGDLETASNLVNILVELKLRLSITFTFTLP